MNFYYLLFLFILIKFNNENDDSVLLLTPDINTINWVSNLE